MSIDTSVQFLGLELDSPFIVGACPMTLDLDHAMEFLHAGAGAIEKLINESNAWAEEMHRTNYQEIVGESCAPRRIFDEAMQRSEATKSLTGKSLTGKSLTGKSLTGTSR